MVSSRMEEELHNPDARKQKQELDEKIKRVILPWCGPVTTLIAKCLRRNIDLEIGYNPGPKLGKLLCNNKEKPPSSNCGIYRIRCKDCSGEYIGETKRDFEIRLKEHTAAIRKGKVEVSHVALHMLENNHEIDINACGLIHKEPRTHHRKWKEALWIKSLKIR